MRRDALQLRVRGRDDNRRSRGPGVHVATPVIAVLQGKESFSQWNQSHVNVAIVDAISVGYVDGIKLRK